MSLCVSTFTNKDGVSTNYPNILLLSTEAIHDGLLQSGYRSGFPGMNGRSWCRIGNIFTLIDKFVNMKKNPEQFIAWLKEQGRMTEENAIICMSALSMKY